MHVEVPRIPAGELAHSPQQPAETSAKVRERVEQARRRQLERTGRTNQAMRNPQIEQFCKLDAKAQGLVHQALERLGLSARAYHRILKLARTIADLAGSPEIQVSHLSEAIGYRRLDRSRS